MPDILSTIATQTGIDVTTLQKTLGAILAFFRSQLKPETYDKLASVIPQADELVKAQEERPGGIGSRVTELASKFLDGSGQAGADFLVNLNRSGVSVDLAARVLPQLFNVLAAHLPPEVVEQLKKAIPAFAGFDPGKILRPGTPQAAPVPPPSSSEAAPGAPGTTGGSSPDFV